MQINTPAKVLNTYFNATVFFFEILAVFLLVFFVLSWKLIAIILEKNENKIFLTVGFVLATFIAIMLPIGFSTIGSRNPVHVSINPLVVIFNSFLLGYGASGQTPLKNGWIGSPILKGIPYLIGAQILGGLLGLIFFYMFFKMYKFVNKNNTNKEDIQALSFLFIFESKTNLTLGKFVIKESFFITLLMVLFPFAGMINTATYSSNHFQIHLVQLVVIGIVILISSFFDFFSFHLAFPIIELIIRTIGYSKLEKKERKNQTKNYLMQWIKFLIVVCLTIIIPILIALTTVAIKIQTKGVISIS
ncbi:Hypothetical protein, predicted transmembrane protein [Metamycoplasma auris 15026]|uniref:Transmembrane protein n=1 Tax=Metamycoplasma auris 15026 TaxID=1188233 RepID=N9VAN8_9BACT|nr:hypothetical protein [Metamycoplasma auris]ENY68723.1 Hypothetical protein, predicted transmembrane protein [Metamycoplasma auris 15026]